MKHFLYPVFGIITILCCFSCGKNPEEGEIKADRAEQVLNPDTTSAMIYLTDSVGSKLVWAGSQLNGTTHTGTLMVKDGKLVIENGVIIGGHFLLDMNKMACTDQNLNVAEKAKLINHLKSKDFFQVASHPFSHFEITGINPYLTPSMGDAKADTTQYKTINPTHNINGNLSIKDSSLNIDFPARVELYKDSVICHARFIINRKNWNLNYMSDPSVGDKLIQPAIKIDMKLKALKQKAIIRKEGI